MNKIPPRPWRVIKTMGADMYGVVSANDRYIGAGRDVADLIVRLVNAEREVVAAMERMRESHCHLLEATGVDDPEAAPAVVAVDVALALLRGDSPERPAADLQGCLDHREHLPGCRWCKQVTEMARPPAADPDVVTALEAAERRLDKLNVGGENDEEIDQVRAALAKVRR